MKLLYAGTPSFAVAPLENLIKNAGALGVEIVGVVTQPDRPQGRKGVLTPSPVKAVALAHGLPVFQPQKMALETDFLADLQADAMITCAYGQILTQAVLDKFPKGVWNVHAGLLPKYRGASPMQSAILAGETETGVCIMQTELGLDVGAILMQRRTPILETETYGELSARLSLLGADLLLDAVKALVSGDFTLTEQCGDEVQTVRKIGKDRAKIDFSCPPTQIVNLVRAMNPDPVAFTSLGGVKLNVYRAEVVDGEWQGKQGEVVVADKKLGVIVRCGEGAIRLVEMQFAGGKRLSAVDFVNGRKLQVGDVFDAQ